MRCHADDDESPDVNMTAMMDCIFLLLIFFLISAAIKKKHEELPIELPHAADSDTVVPNNDTLVISMVNRGRGQIEYAMATVGQQLRSTGGAREMVTFQELIVALKKAAAEKSDRKVRLDIDVTIPVDKVVQVTDHLKLYQLRQVGLRMRDLKQ